MGSISARPAAGPSRMAIARRQEIYWGQERLKQLNARLAHARAHCDWYVATDELGGGICTGVRLQQAVYLSAEVRMETITVTVTDDRLSKLREIAANLNVSVEELIHLSIDSLLLQPEAEFQQAVEYTLNKNRELYRRLA